MTEGYPNKRARTQRAILRGAMEVMARHGMGALTAASISRAAGVSTGTLYNHYDGVDAVADAVAQQLASVLAFGTTSLDRLTGDPAARIALGVLQVLELPVADRVYAQAFLAAMAERPAFRQGVRELVHDQVIRGVDRGVFHVADPWLATDALTGAVLQPMRSMLLGEISLDQRQHVAELALRILGVPADEVAQVLERAVSAPA